MMTKTKVISIAISALLMSGGSTYMPADTTQNTATAPAVYSEASVQENGLATETSVNSKTDVELVTETPSTELATMPVESAYAPTEPKPVESVQTTSESKPVESVQTTPAPEIASSICRYYVKPGEQRIEDNGLVITWTDFQLVTETCEGSSVTLSGLLNGELWIFSYTDDGQVDSSTNLPLTYDFSGCALGLPIAACYGPTALEGWTFETAERVTYSHAPGTCYVSGDGWEALILDYRRYEEWKEPGNFDESSKYTLVAYNSETWVIATEGAPDVEPESSESVELDDIDVLTENIRKNTMSMQDITNPKWGAIIWSDSIREEITNNTVTYWLEAELNDRQFSIEIDDETALGFTEEHTWSAAIVPADFVTRENTSTLHYKQYDISVVNGSIRIENKAANLVRNVSIDGMSDSTTLLTLTDGKHAKCVTMRPELIAVIYAICSN